MNEDASPTELDAWLRRLEAAHPVDIELSLDRVTEVARRMGLLDGPVAQRVITVAGTNGKGSTVALLESLATHHGLSSAAYTSPHLFRYNERLHLNGREADDEALMKGFRAVEAARLDGEPISLTYFEVGTLAALSVIRRQMPQLAILEVGLGGRLDAVNVVDADVAVVTTIALDHAAFLGNDLEVIGREKAGIMRPGRPAVLGSRQLPGSVRAAAHACGAPVHVLGEDFDRQGAARDWQWSRQGQLRIDELPDPALPLDNAATALTALDLAGVSLQPEACRAAMQSVALPGRMQWQGAWCFDVGHNPQAAAYVADRLADDETTGTTYALLGMLADKDADGVIDALSPAIDAWLPVSLEGDRARHSHQLAECLQRHGQTVIECAASPTEGARRLASHLAPEDRVLVCGSFFTVAEVLAARENPSQTDRGDTAQGMTRE
ncbi:bifunctional tetrahydrofolate synthase/dihydrofolate synthase [Halomonas sp. 18H]|uniref:bifunctional tetrahydrofolate synthase/dihydrofolate synthase n=1 Tax=Halomonas almeriensis TaxID=308163 RepID=UPI002231B340|nr:MULTISPECIES: bifunctional tetrahydrofolate synthase/dihydrofolate synthase [Halomonas]MCW4151126.1 bifunctional tetrahydrofolate synthase/dihydrofolate synthase [Halomonas sp. 18H]MDN3553006.1 bifunctional tetrahydrofolate synthase/dihydrofolate synthase [Halomonas almeriensis]